MFLHLLWSFKYSFGIFVEYLMLPFLVSSSSVVVQVSLVDIFQEFLAVVPCFPVLCCNSNNIWGHFSSGWYFFCPPCRVFWPLRSTLGVFCAVWQPTWSSLLRIFFCIWRTVQHIMGELANFKIVRLNIYNVHTKNVESNRTSPTNNDNHTCLIGHSRTTDTDKWLVDTLEDNGIDKDDPVCLHGHSSSDSDTTCSRMNTWLIDSGASDHMTDDKSLFSTLSETKNCGFQMGNDTVMEVNGRGFVKIELIVQGRRVPCMIQNVLYVPNIKFKLWSVSAMEAERTIILF